MTRTANRLDDARMLAGRYRIVGELGAGAQGRVLAATDSWAGDRPVAIKQIDSGAFDVARAEFAALTKLRHPAMVAALDLVADDGHVYLVEERIGGTSLWDWGQTRRAREVAAAVAPVAHALMHLHARGWVHLDPSPRNVLIERDPAGEPRGTLIDLGLARPVSTRGLAGTPGLIAPEVLAGEPAGAAADIYALAASVVATLTGQPPAHDAAFDLGQIDIPDARELLTACLRTEPSSRPDAADLLRGLCRIGGIDIGHFDRPLTSLPLCGRRAELANLDEWLGQGGPSFAVFGREGAGVSALLSAFADRARLQGRRVIVQSADVPDALATLVARALASTSSPATSVAAARRELASLEAADLSDRERAEVRVLALEHLSGTEGPAGARRSELLVMLDDAHRADPELRRALAIWRSRKTTGGVRVLIGSHGDADDAQPQLTLGPLSDDEIGQLLTVAYAQPRPEAEARRWVALCGRWGANLMAGLRAVSRTGATFFELDADQITATGDLQLPEALRVLALVDGDAPESLVRALVGNDEAGLTAIRNSIESGGVVLTEVEGSPRLRVPTAFRKGVELSERERRDGHGRLARAWTNHGEPLRAAPHLAASGDVEGAMRALDEAQAAPDACRRAMRAVADVVGLQPFSTAALETWIRMVGEAGDVDRARELSEVLRARGQWAVAQAALAVACVKAGRYEDALREAESLEPGPLRAVPEARALYFAGRVEAAAEVAARSVDDAEGPARWQLLDVLGHAALVGSEPQRAVELLERARTEAADAGDVRWGARAEHALAIVLQRTGQRERAAELYRSALENSDALSRITRTLNYATLLQELGDLASARAHYRKAWSRASALANAREQGRIGVNLANLEVLLGELAQGGRIARETAELCSAAGMRHAAAMARLVEGEAALERRAIDEARGALDAAADSLKDIEDPVAPAELALLKARLATLCGDGDAALEALTGVDARAAPHLPAQLAYRRARVGLLGKHDAPTFVRAASEAVALADELGDAELLWRARAVLYRLQQRAGQPSAVDSRQKAADALAEWTARLTPELRNAYLSTAERRQLTRWIAPPSESVLPMSTVAPGVAHLKRLVAINRRMAREHGLDALFEVILDAAIELLGAERGFLIVAEDVDGGKDEGDDGDLRVAVARNFDRRTLADGGDKISRSIASRVFSDGEAVLTTNAQEDARFADAKSVSALRVRSVVCVPLRRPEREEDPLIGALYLDHRFQERAFTAADVDLCEAFADQAAIALTNARLLDRTRSQEEQLLAQNRRLEALNAELQKRVATFAAEADAAMRRLREEGPSVGVGRGFERFVGTSDALREALRLVDRFADTDVPVTVYGESGTGKELVARAIHERSRRRDGPFVSVNCGAIPETLLESELFGYRRGAFTGAVKDKDGLFAAARGGTLFLDEVGEMSPGMQVKLLRVLQEGEFRPVGATQNVSADVRIVSASHRNLSELVKTGSFREDLFYRLHVVEITMPPLRERRGDIPPLVEHFTRQIEAVAMEEVFSPEAMACLLGYDWPGNVRELENEVRRALALREGMVRVADLNERVQGARVSGSATLAEVSRGSLKDIMEGFEREVLIACLRRTGWNVRQTAKELGLSRAALYTRLSRYGIERES